MVNIFFYLPDERQADTGQETLKTFKTNSSILNLGQKPQTSLLLCVVLLCQSPDRMDSFTGHGTLGIIPLLFRM